MDGHRTAALALHSLHEADRDWLLAQLPAGDRIRLDGLLGELAELGIPTDAGRSHSRMAARVAEARPAAPATALERLRAASASEVFDALSGEPATLLAACIALDDWPWRVAFLARFRHERRVELSALSREREAFVRAPRMREALLARLDARIAEVRARPSHRGTLGRIRGWMEARWKAR